MTATRTADVVVVGAGFAGLSAALELESAGFDAIVLEARDRVGGRVLNHELANGEVVEVGGQWVGPTQHALLELAADVGVETYPTHLEGDNLIVYRGRVRRYRGTIPRINPAVLLEIERLRRKLNRLCRQVPPDAPWNASRAERWDRITFAEWMRRNSLTPGARMLVTLVIRSVFGTEPEDVSFLHVLFYLASAGGFDALVDTRGGAQDSRFVGGSQLVAIRMAERLGDRVVLGAPVRRIENGDESVRVEADGVTVDAKRAIVAMSPTLAARIAYSPALPGRRDQMSQRMPQGAIIKCMAVYPEPFWRGDGLSGSGLADGASVNAIFDNSPPGGSPGVLLGFLDGRAARVWSRRTPDERRGAVVDVFTRLFGERAANPDDYVERNWANEEWSRGCYSGAFGPSGWTDFGAALREPVGRIHWAGTETATVWNGYIDGAIIVRAPGRRRSRVRRLANLVDRGLALVRRGELRRLSVDRRLLLERLLLVGGPGLLGRLFHLRGRELGAGAGQVLVGLLGAKRLDGGEQLLCQALSLVRDLLAAVEQRGHGLVEAPATCHRLLDDAVRLGLGLGDDFVRPLAGVQLQASRLFLGRGAHAGGVLLRVVAQLGRRLLGRREDPGGSLADFERTRSSGGTAARRSSRRRAPRPSRRPSP